MFFILFIRFISQAKGIEWVMIFNLIKDNGQCNNKLKANTNSNTAVFLLNCLFNIDLEYEEKMHHISFSSQQENYGKVIRAF